VDVDPVDPAQDEGRPGRYQSSNSRGRELRHVADDSNGSWLDVGRKLIAERL
jgi:hypothetical protein